jgi:UDP-N-acetylmuramyl pentapeptide phosphotransferase/UDP-N-acetylglucosamine-1-phosphate transferase
LRATVTLVIAAFVSAALTRVFLALMTGRAVVAHENERTMHKGRIPVGAGWPVLVAALCVALVLWPVTKVHASLLPWIAVLALVSWADDVNTLSPAVRFPIHIVAVLASLFALPEQTAIFGGALPLVADRLLAAFLLVWFVNLTNFMDGIDGITGVETIAVAVGYVLVRSFLPGSSIEPLVGLMSATAGAALGFLVWNWHPARIFLGDVGAVPLGFIMGLAMIDLAIAGQPAAALILPLYYLADATITLLRRLARGETPWHAHREHFYQRAALAAGSHTPVVMRIIACNAALVACAALSLKAPLIALPVAIAAVGALLASLAAMARSAPAASAVPSSTS